MDIACESPSKAENIIISIENKTVKWKLRRSPLMLKFSGAVLRSLKALQSVYEATSNPIGTTRSDLGRTNRNARNPYASQMSGFVGLYDGLENDSGSETLHTYAANQLENAVLAFADAGLSPPFELTRLFVKFYLSDDENSIIGSSMEKESSNSLTSASKIVFDAFAKSSMKNNTLLRLAVALTAVEALRALKHAGITKWEGDARVMLLKNENQASIEILDEKEAAKNNNKKNTQSHNEGFIGTSIFNQVDEDDAQMYNFDFGDVDDEEMDGNDYNNVRGQSHSNDDRNNNIATINEDDPLGFLFASQPINEIDTDQSESDDSESTGKQLNNNTSSVENDDSLKNKTALKLKKKKRNLNRIIARLRWLLKVAVSHFHWGSAHGARRDAVLMHRVSRILPSLDQIDIFTYTFGRAGLMYVSTECLTGLLTSIARDFTSRLASIQFPGAPHVTPELIVLRSIKVSATDVSLASIPHAVVSAAFATMRVCPLPASLLYALNSGSALHFSGLKSCLTPQLAKLLAILAPFLSLQVLHGERALSSITSHMDDDSEFAAASRIARPAEVAAGIWEIASNILAAAPPSCSFVRKRAQLFSSECSPIYLTAAARVAAIEVFNLEEQAHISNRILKKQAISDLKHVAQRNRALKQIEEASKRDLVETELEELQYKRSISKLRRNETAQSLHEDATSASLQFAAAVTVVKGEFEKKFDFQKFMTNFILRLRLAVMQKAEEAARFDSNNICDESKNSDNDDNSENDNFNFWTLGLTAPSEDEPKNDTEKLKEDYKILSAFGLFFISSFYILIKDLEELYPNSKTHETIIFPRGGPNPKVLCEIIQSITSLQQSVVPY